ncbi:MAG: glycosyltransferase [Opitutaceae bacterium]|nr:glycosyltransferase [Opitutaceae bacterium]
MIPCYNSDSDLLAKTLRSVLYQDQGCDMMQIELIDDCSPKGAPIDVARTVSGSRIHVHRETKNLGLAGIWNRCIERARGDIVHILHQDDLVYPGYYKAMQRGFDDNPKIGAAFSRYAYCDANDHWQSLPRLLSSIPVVLDNLYRKIATEDCIQCASISVRKSTYEKIGGFSSKLKHALDWEMWMRISSSYPLYYDPSILAAWRRHSSATTSRQINNGENTMDIVDAIELWRAYLPASERTQLASAAKRQHAQGALLLAEGLLREGKKTGALQHLKAATLLDERLSIKAYSSYLRLKFAVRFLIQPIARGKHG